ncbi:MAG: hypothetical protein NTZ18_01310 [Candidatus Komeilibacteria bacterium]|nr:hypothetical protein [Candidatus Komeilibacteria bacterium]
MLLARILSIVAPFFISLVMALLGWSPANVFYPIGLSFALLLFTLWLLLKLSRQAIGAREMFFYLFKGFLYLAGAILFFLFLETVLFKIALVGLTLAVLLFYYNQLFNHFYKHSWLAAQPQFFSFNYLEVLGIFFIASSLAGIRDFLDWPVWLLILILFFLVFIADLFNRLVAFGQIKLAVVDAAISSLILTEIFWAILGNSFVYYIKGLLFASVYLMLTVAANLYYKKLQPASIFKVYLTAVLIIGGIILLTARWF